MDVGDFLIQQRSKFLLFVHGFARISGVFLQLDVFSDGFMHSHNVYWMFSCDVWIFLLFNDVPMNVDLLRSEFAVLGHPENPD